MYSVHRCLASDCDAGWEEKDELPKLSFVFWDLSDSVVSGERAAEEPPPPISRIQQHRHGAIIFIISLLCTNAEPHRHEHEAES